MAKKNFFATDADEKDKDEKDEKTPEETKIEQDNKTVKRDNEGHVQTDLTNSTNAKGESAALPTVDQPRDKIDEANDPHRRVSPVDLKNGRRVAKVVDNPEGGHLAPSGERPTVVLVPLDHFTREEAKAVDDREERIYKYNRERKEAGLPIAITKEAQDLIP